MNVENGVPIKSWYDDKDDNDLQRLSPILECLAYVPDVRDYIKKFCINNEILYSNSKKIIESINSSKNNLVLANSKSNNYIDNSFTTNITSNTNNLISNNQSQSNLKPSNNKMTQINNLNINQTMSSKSQIMTQEYNNLIASYNCYHNNPSSSNLTNNNVLNNSNPMQHQSRTLDRKEELSKKQDRNERKTDTPKSNAMQNGPKGGTNPPLNSNNSNRPLTQLQPNLSNTNKVVLLPEKFNNLGSPNNLSSTNMPLKSKDVKDINNPNNININIINNHINHIIISPKDDKKENASLLVNDKNKNMLNNLVSSIPNKINSFLDNNNPSVTDSFTNKLNSFTKNNMTRSNNNSVGNINNINNTSGNNNKNNNLSNIISINNTNSINSLNTPKISATSINDKLKEKDSKNFSNNEAAKNMYDKYYTNTNNTHSNYNNSSNMLITSNSKYSNFEDNASSSTGLKSLNIRPISSYPVKPPIPKSVSNNFINNNGHTRQISQKSLGSGNYNGLYNNNTGGLRRSNLTSTNFMERKPSINSMNIPSESNILNSNRNRISTTTSKTKQKGFSNSTK